MKNRRDYRDSLVDILNAIRDIDDLLKAWILNLSSKIERSFMRLSVVCKS